MYFLRLAQLKPAVEEQAEEAWGNMRVSVTRRALKETTLIKLDCRLEEIAHSMPKECLMSDKAYPAGSWGQYSSK